MSTDSDAEPYRINLDRQRSVREILVATLGLYRRYPWLFVVLALAVVGPYDLAFLGITGYGPLFRRAHHGVELRSLNFVLRVGMVGALISALHIHAVLEVGRGRRPRLRAVAARGLAVLPIVGPAVVMTGVATLIGILALIIPGIYLALRFAVVAQAAALRSDGPFAAIRRSRALTLGHYQHIGGLFLIVLALDLGLTEGARAVLFGGRATTGAGVVAVAIGIAVQTILATFSALTLALLYFDLCARDEPLHKRKRRPVHLRELDAPA